MRQDVLDGGGYVTGDRVRNLGAAADVGAVDVHLCHVGIRQEVVVREVGTQQDEQVSLVGGLVCRTVAQQAVHAYVERVLVLDVHLATQSVADRSLDLLRQLEHLLTGVLNAGANEQGDGISLVDGLGQGSSLGRIREDDRATGRDLGLNKGVIVSLLHGDVTRDNQDGNAIAGHAGLDGVVQDNAALLSGVDHLAVARALLEDCLWVGLLEELGADLAGWDVGSQCQHLSAVAVGIVQALDQVGIARAAGCGTYSQLAGGQGICLGSEGCCFLVADVNPLDGGATNGIHDRVQGVTDEAINALDTLLFQGVN